MFWHNLIEPIFGYIALCLVFGTVLIILYVLIVSTFLIRRLIAPEFDIPKVGWQVHKWFFIGVGIIYSSAFILFATTFIPLIFGFLVFYLFGKYVFPLFVKKIST